MSSVVLRCPNCGTTRSSPGECEACHESQVRYYCTRHTPGLWLDAKNCPACGARFGEAVQPPRAAALSLTRRPPAAAPPQSPKPAPRPRAVPAKRPGSGVPGGDHLRRPPGDRDVKVDARRIPGDREVHVTGWDEMIRAASSARRRPVEPADLETPFDPGAMPGRRPGGCLTRILLMMVLLFLALASGVFVFGASVLQMFMRF
ncbi:MAG: hypothetical protein JWR74_47 [Polaromonas sp.]|nr:hypothetical protein [Polaromonas sp.]